MAYSGGVDSALLLALAVRTLGPDEVVALLGVSPSLARSERARAHETAAFIGARVVEVPTRESQNPDYARNDVDRCFFCKDELFTRIGEEVVAAHGLAAVAYGENADDAGASGPAGRTGGDEPPGPASAVRGRADQGAGAPGGPRPRAAGGRQARRAVPGLAHPARRGGHAREARAGRARRGGPARAGLLRRPRAPPRGHRPHRAADGGDRPRGRGDVRLALDAGIREAGFRFVAVDLRGIQSGAFTLPLLAVGGRG
ncbi:ATP-binding protein [Georgenia sp. SUBG003]|uniref:ATP-binding protein n=1 Tax=Georgenia sp. SUBG003 TaxID=1497974 RepID=UPI000B22E37B